MYAIAFNLEKHNILTENQPPIFILGPIFINGFLFTSQPKALGFCATVHAQCYTNEKRATEKQAQRLTQPPKGAGTLKKAIIRFNLKQ